MSANGVQTEDTASLAPLPASSATWESISTMRAMTAFPARRANSHQREQLPSQVASPVHKDSLAKSRDLDFAPHAKPGLFLPPTTQPAQHALLDSFQAWPLLNAPPVRAGSSARRKAAIFVLPARPTRIRLSMPQNVIASEPLCVMKRLVSVSAHLARQESEPSARRVRLEHSRTRTETNSARVARRSLSAPPLWQVEEGRHRR